MLKNEVAEAKSFTCLSFCLDKKFQTHKENFSFDNRGDLQCKSSFVEKVRRGDRQRDPAKVPTRN
jgi:hypothetical protein